MKNYFSVGLELIEALETKRDEWGVKKIDTVGNIGQINQEITPALYVINTRGGVSDAIRGVEADESQQWSVVVAVAHRASQTNTIDLMEKGGELISQVIEFVQAFMPSHAEPLKRVQPASQPTYFTTFGLFTLTFETKFTI